MVELGCSDLSIVRPMDNFGPATLDQPFAQINRKRFQDTGWPSEPAHILNKVSTRFRLPHESKRLDASLATSIPG